ncbi:MAG: DUF188 domain-containing protein [Clostridia bacterium]
MRILIDADGCPVVNQTVKLSMKYDTDCFILCDTSHRIEKDGAITMIFSKGADSVDFALVNFMQTNDIVITQDYGLAAMCLAKKGIVINQNGMIYDDSNIEGLLMQRHISKKVRKAGGRLKGPSKRTADQDVEFEKTLTSFLENIDI